MATYGYVRVSTSDQASDDKTSLDTQRQKIAAVASILDLTVDETFEEPGVSGTMPLADRPAGSRMIERLKTGDTVIISKLDRGFRSASDALRTVDGWRSRGIHLVVIDMGLEPVTASGASHMFFGMLALVAQFERERIRERVEDGRRGKRARGGHTGGSAPFGYRVVGKGRESKLVPDDVEQEAAALIRGLVGSGVSLRKVAERVKNGFGLDVSHMTVKRVASRQPGSDTDIL